MKKQGHSPLLFGHLFLCSHIHNNARINVGLGSGPVWDQEQGSVCPGSGLSVGLGSGLNEGSFLIPFPSRLRNLPSLTHCLKTIYPASGVSGPVFGSPIFSPSTLVRPIMCSTPCSYAGIPTAILSQSYDLSRGDSRWEVHSCIPNWPSETQQGWPALWHECVPKPRRSSLWVTSGFSIIHSTAPTPLAQVI